MRPIEQAFPIMSNFYPDKDLLSHMLSEIHSCLTSASIATPLLQIKRVDKYQVAALLLVLGVVMVTSSLRSKKKKTAAVEINKTGVIVGGTILIIFAILIFLR